MHFEWFELIQKTLMVSGFVLMLMIIIEYINVRTAGKWNQGVAKNRFFQLLNERYKWLMSKPKGWTFYIPSSKEIKTNEDRDLLIKMTCLFISEGNGYYHLSEDFTTIMRR